MVAVAVVLASAMALSFGGSVARHRVGRGGGGVGNSVTFWQ